MVRSSLMLFATTLRNWLFDGMSNPLVGSSISSSLVLAARAKLMYTFFFCPIDSSLRLMSGVSSKSLRQLLSTSRLKRG